MLVSTFDSEKNNTGSMYFRRSWIASLIQSLVL